MEIKKVLMIGAGQMGNGITQVMAMSGRQVAMFDVKQEFVDKGIATIEKSLNRSVEKGKMTQDEKDAVMGRITTGVEWGPEDCDVDLAMEAVIEDMDLKKALFKKLDEWCPERTIFATNTSTLPVTAMGGVTNRPHKMIGMHFFSPVPIMKLIEGVVGLATDEETYKSIEVLGNSLPNKTFIKVADSPGFVGNRIMVPMMNEAIYTLFEGVAEPKVIDDVALLGFNHPIGPLRLCDAIGLDTILHVMEILYGEYGDTKYRPCPLLRKYVEAGWLGKKAGRGFYNDYKK